MDYTTTIERFLNNEMNNDERALFLEQIQQDEELKNAVETYKEMQLLYNDNDWEITDRSNKHPKIMESLAFLQSKEGERIKSIIQQEGVLYFTEKPKTKKGIFSIITTVSSIAAIFLIGFFLFKNFTNPSNVDLYNDYKNDWQELPSLTLRGDNSHLTDIETLFKQKNYTKVLALLETSQKNNSKFTDPQLLIYLGITQLELDKNNEAVETFNKLLQGNNLDAYKGHWYLALSYLKLNNTSLAKQELQLILSDTANFKDKEAKEILKKIKE